MSWSFDRVEEVLPQAAANGSLSAEQLQAALGTSIGGTIVGAVPLREALELTGWSRRQAHAVAARATAAGTISVSSHGIPYASFEAIERLGKRR